MSTRTSQPSALRLVLVPGLIVLAILGCLGGLAFGGLTIGGCGIGIMVFGGLAIGYLAIGGCAIGYAAIGGLAIGYYALGGAALGKFVVSAMHRDPQAIEFFTHLMNGAFLPPAVKPGP